MVQRAHVRQPRGERVGERTGFVAAAVVDDQDLEAVPVRKSGQMIDDQADVLLEHPGLVEGGQHDRNQRARRGRRQGELPECDGGRAILGRRLAARR
jgi:hypothetical protein